MITNDEIETKAALKKRLKSLDGGSETLALSMGISARAIRKALTTSKSTRLETLQKIDEKLTEKLAVQTAIKRGIIAGTLGVANGQLTYQ